MKISDLEFTAQAFTASLDSDDEVPGIPSQSLFEAPVAAIASIASPA